MFLLGEFGLLLHVVFHDLVVLSQVADLLVEFIDDLFILVLRFSE